MDNSVIRCTSLSNNQLCRLRKVQLMFHRLRLTSTKSTCKNQHDKLFLILLNNILLLVKEVLDHTHRTLYRLILTKSKRTLLESWGLIIILILVLILKANQLRKRLSKNKGKVCPKKINKISAKDNSKINPPKTLIILQIKEQPKIRVE